MDKWDNTKQEAKQAYAEADQAVRNVNNASAKYWITHAAAFVAGLAIGVLFF